MSVGLIDLVLYKQSTQGGSRSLMDMLEGRPLNGVEAIYTR